MFIQGKARAWYTRRGEQRGRGYFLVLMYSSADEWRTMAATEIRGLVRAVELRQAGHFMMGQLELAVGGRVFAMTLSGAYGSDGSAMKVPPEVFAIGVPLTPELRGAEAPLLDAWARTLRYPASTMRGNK